MKRCEVTLVDLMCRPIFSSLSLTVILFLSTNFLSAEGEVHAYVGAKLIPITADPIEDGVLLVQDDKIVGIGSANELEVPDGAVVHDVSGKVIMPGLICTHSHIGQVSGGDASAPIQPEVRAYDAINVRDSRIEKARAGGITTVNIMPGSGHL